ncbi:MAG: CocE/NonD family hydrolase [Acidimicrobiia bacterium]
MTSFIGGEIPLQRARLAVITLVVALAAPLGLATTAGATGGATASVTAADAPLVVRDSVHQVDVLHAPTGLEAMLYRHGVALQFAPVDDLGGVVFHNVASGTEYGIWIFGGGTSIVHPADVTVLDASATPPQSLYANQHLDVSNLGGNAGYGYLTTRDGTQLSVQVVLPGPPEDGPYPAVMEYSGYDPSSPSTSQPQYKLMLPPSGYAWVGVNIRGTGCSGGAFNFFENLQSLDGYDAIETIAAQPWSNGHVGMVGISYAGISQLFVARSRPPHLDAITPVSVIDDTWRGTLYPGGIFNNGFALSWAQERVDQNKWPNPDAPQWVTDRIANGDATCADNMLLRGENVDLLDQINKHPNPSTALDPEFTYDFPNGSASLAPAEFADQIRAKVFLAGAWQDEQTGGHWANMINRFQPGVLVRAEGQNGVHTEALDPQVAFDELEFLDLYVGHRTPRISDGVRAFAPALWTAITGIGGLQIPPDRFTGQTYDQALSAYQQEPKIKILWETGNADGFEPGALVPRAQTGYSAWPIPDVQTKRWYFHGNGTLTRNKPTGAEPSDSYRPDPTLRPRGDFPGGNVWAATPTYDWEPVVDGASLAYLSDPLAKTTTMAGTGSVDLWVSSTATDNDVQVTLSEVLPDGQERYVQNGWLKLSHRKVDSERSTDLNPVHTDEAADMRPLVPGQLVKARVALFPFAHQFRAGSRIRITIQAPGGDRPEWKFDTAATGGNVLNVVAHDADHPSRVVLPVLPNGPNLGATAAPCPSLRAQPCRAYVAPGS